jgi:hypothetical protein
MAKRPPPGTPNVGQRFLGWDIEQECRAAIEEARKGEQCM